MIIVIDRAGKIAYRSDIAAGDHSLSASFRKIAQDPASLTEQQLNERVERTVTDELEKALKQKD